MRVWLIQIGEVLPVDGPHMRLMRTGTLAKTLVAQGHEVSWWSTAFSHSTKSYRTRERFTIRLHPRWALKLLPSCGYSKNVSLARLRDHAQLARAFSRLAPREQAPDVLVCCLPTPRMGCVAADYADIHGVPLVVDLRDKWPDVFLDLLPGPLRPLGRLGLGWMSRQTAEACSRATGLIGVTESYLNWGLRHARRARGRWDRVLPIGYQRPRLPPAVIEQARQFWDRQGIPVDDGRLTVCFFGTLGRQFALDTVLEAARIVQQQGQQIRIVLCGKGDSADRFRRAARGLPGVLFPGWIDAPRIQALLERSHLGLAPYRGTANFVGHVPNKPAEYLSAGLPVVSTLVQRLDTLLDQYKCGFTYEPDNSRQLAEILGRLARDRQSLRAMSAGARRLFDDHFDGDKIYPAYVEHLERMAQLARGARRAA